MSWGYNQMQEAEARPPQWGSSQTLAAEKARPKNVYMSLLGEKGNVAELVVPVKDLNQQVGLPGLNVSSHVCRHSCLHGYHLCRRLSTLHTRVLTVVADLPPRQFAWLESLLRRVSWMIRRLSGVKRSAFGTLQHSLRQPPTLH